MSHHRAIKIAKPAIQRVMALLELAPGEDDQRLKLDSLEAETDLFEIVSALLNENETDEGVIEALGQQVAERASRKERALARIDARKAAISSLMEYAQETTLRLPEATISLRTLGPRHKVTDPTALPEAFTIAEMVRKPNREAIAAAIESGQDIPGVTMTNGGTSLTVRRK